MDGRMRSEYHTSNNSIFFFCKIFYIIKRERKRKKQNNWIDVIKIYKTFKMIRLKKMGSMNLGHVCMALIGLSL